MRALLLGGVALAISVGAACAQARSSCVVERVIDGDTFVCGDGERIRLILVDTPEMDDEPLGDLARGFVVDRMPPGTPVGLEIGVDERDRYGRVLAYVRLPDGRMLNRVLARAGYAQVMVVPPNVRHVEAIRSAVDSARAEGAGLWGRSPGFSRRFDPSEPPDGREDEARCHPSYPDVCIPPPPPDLDCGDVGQRGFRVRPPDPHRFDGDGNGFGCENL